MSRPIAYNLPAAAINGSITNEDAVISYVVDGRGNDYFNNYESCNWVPSADGAAPIVFVTDTFTRGYEGNPNLAVPLFFACAGTSSAAILYTANRLPGSPGNYTNANTAIDELNRTYGYFILESNDPFQGDFQNGNLLTIDASKMTSYPQTANNWYDMSGNGFSFSLLNGPSFNSNGWFNMDGADDSIGLAGNTTLKTTNTLVMWLRTTDTTGLLLTGNPPGTTGGQYVAAYFPGQGFYSGAAGSPNYFMDTLATADPATPINYLDGRFHMWEVKGLSFGAWTNDWYFLSYAAGYQIAGDVAKIQMFDSSLTSAQSKQLYFGSPIVTDGLVFAVDANNIVSYPKSGTAWYNLTGSNIGTFINGPTFNQDNGGSIRFDGTDDYVNVPTAANLDLTSQGTISVWINPATITQGTFAGLVSKNSGGSANLQSYTLSWRQISNAFLAQICDGAGTYNEIFAPLPTVANVWYNIVFTWNGSQLVLYNNGVVIGTTTQTINNQVLATDLTIGGFTYKGAGGGGEPFNGKIANTKLYNRGLTAAEIQQNYQAEQYRFEGPAGIVTNGLQLYYDFGNLDSYPSTGTTVYDLSGNNNNGTLINSPGWNSTNGGTIIWDGVDDYINTGKTATQLGFYNANYTMEAWVYPTSLSSDRTMFGTDQSDTRQGLHLVFRSGQIYQGHYASDFGAGTVTTNNWFQIVYTYNASTGVCEIFKNNVSQGTGSILSFIGTTNILLARWGNQFNFQGNGSIYKIYNRVLTTAEMTQNYNYFKGRFGL
jgi:hypothetical protein